MVNKFSELKIIFSNCLFDGSSWSDIKSTFVSFIKQSLFETSGIDFRGINANNVSGDHSSCTIIVLGTFYNLHDDVNKEEMVDLEFLARRIAIKIPGFSCTEIRVEHTRHRTNFQGLSHPQLAKTI